MALWRRQDHGTVKISQRLLGVEGQQEASMGKGPGMFRAVKLLWVLFDVDTLLHACVRIQTDASRSRRTRLPYVSGIVTAGTQQCKMFTLEDEG